jgi:hypothetical protein
MGGRSAQRPVLHVNESKKTGARSARARMRGQNPLVSYICHAFTHLTNRSQGGPNGTIKGSRDASLHSWWRPWPASVFRHPSSQSGTGAFRYPDWVTLFRYRTDSGISISFHCGTGLIGCRTFRYSGILIDS